jgi:hypothetical protein
MTKVGKLALKNPDFKQVIMVVPGLVRFIRHNLHLYMGLKKPGYGGEAREAAQTEGRPLCAD